MLDVKIKCLRPDAVLPQYATAGSAAMDLALAADAPLTLAPGERVLAPTGLAIAPDGTDYVALVCARSGLSSKHGIAMANGVGVVDADYRGELRVPLINLGAEPYTVAPGERIAQLMFLPVAHAHLISVDALDDTPRGAGGFGSTGK